MKKGYIDRGMVALVILMLVARLGESAVVKIAFEAKVTLVWDNLKQLDGMISLGDILTGTYSYDTATLSSGPASAPWSHQLRAYEYDAVPFGVTVVGGSLSFMTDPTNVDFDVVVGTFSDILTTHDRFGWISHSNVSPANDMIVGSIRLSASGSDGTLSELVLPAGPLDVTMWDSVSLLIKDAAATELGSWHIQADVTSMELVPEPATVMLLAVGFALARRRRPRV